MKKVFKIIAITIIILILVIVILFCSKINKISIIENIKQKIAKTEEIQTANEVTIIDVTDLEDNGNLEHEHIFKTIYDENKHWEECKICRKKNNEASHTYKTTWAEGKESCVSTNSYTATCSCGYSYIGHKPCVWDGKSYYPLSSHKHTKKCKVCGLYIMYSYYMNTYGSGRLYEIKETETTEYCYSSSGLKLDCSVSGRCYKCSGSYVVNKHRLDYLDGKIICSICNKEFGTITNTITTDSSTPPIYTIISNIILTNGATFNSLDTRLYPQYYQKDQQSLIEGKVGGTNIIIKSIKQASTNVKENMHNDISIHVKIAGTDCWFMMVPTNVKFYSDLVSPEISSILTENEDSLTEWSKNKTIIISGKENWTNNVTIEILDDNGNSIFKGKSIVTNGNYSVSCTPEIEVGMNGRTFTAIVTDDCNNITTQEFTIAKVDSIPPILTSSREVGGEWAKSKDFTFTTTDNGIGQVSIAFNDIKDMQLAKEDKEIFTRNYTFVGDVYQPKELSVMYRDGLGNTSIQKITIDKLDNTAPSITNATLYNNKLIIESHDRHESLGEGSGVTKYRYLASEGKLENLELTNENSIEMMKDEEIIIQDIYKMKYIYLLAEDLVGNISEVYEFEVPQLKLTSTANLNTTNGEGEIILDWSSYDIEDKYFVVYRKKENETEWKTIVSLEEKLTGSTYTDILANDEANPSTPNITITGDVENNNINITANSSDSGTKYTYYIEAYDNTGTLLSKSN